MSRLSLSPAWWRMEAFRFPATRRPMPFRSRMPSICFDFGMRLTNQRRESKPRYLMPAKGSASPAAPICRLRLDPHKVCPRIGPRNHLLRGLPPLMESLHWCSWSAAIPFFRPSLMRGLGLSVLARRRDRAARQFVERIKPTPFIELSRQFRNILRDLAKPFTSSDVGLIVHAIRRDHRCVSRSSSGVMRDGLLKRRVAPAVTEGAAGAHDDYWRKRVRALRR